MPGMRLLLAFIVTVALSSCVTTDPRLVTALQRTSVTQIRVETAPDVTMGGFIDRTKPDPQLPAVIRTMQSVMARELTGLPGGPVQGRLIVTLHMVDVSSKAGRIIAGNDSYIAGTVRLEDAKTGQLIAQAQSIRAEDRGMRGEGLGIVVAMAVNAAQSQQEDALALRLSNSFTQQVKAWLTQK